MTFYLCSRYVCEYTYYTSLSVDSSRTLFVHVPELVDYSAAETARALEHLLDLCLQQLREVGASREIDDKMKDSSLQD